MVSNPLHILMVIVIALSGMVGHAARASISCCGASGFGVVAVDDALPADGVSPRGCCDGCSIEPGHVQTSPGEDGSEGGKHCPQDGPCDDDCHCSLCGAVSVVTGAVLPSGSAGLFRTSQPNPIPFEQEICARDQRFDLLRPPQC